MNSMSDTAIEKAIKNASASIEMEGFYIDDQSKEWCRMLQKREITIEEYINLVKQKARVEA